MPNGAPPSLWENGQAPFQPGRARQQAVAGMRLPVVLSNVGYPTPAQSFRGGWVGEKFVARMPKLVVAI